MVIATVIMAYYSLALIVWCMKLTLNMFIKVLVKTRIWFSNYLAKSKLYDILNKLVVRKMKDEVKPNVCLFW